MGMDEGIGQRIRQVRNACGLTQRELAEAIGVTSGYLSRLERADAEPSEMALLSIARHLGARLHWLRTGEEPMLEPSADALLGFASRLLGEVNAAGALPADRLADFVQQLRALQEHKAGEEAVKAWAKGKALRSWFDPESGQIVSAEMDAQPGGDNLPAQDLQRVGEILQEAHQATAEGDDRPAAAVAAWRRVLARLRRCAADRARLEQLELALAEARLESPSGDQDDEPG